MGRECRIFFAGLQAAVMKARPDILPQHQGCRETRQDNQLFVKITRY